MPEELTPEQAKAEREKLTAELWTEDGQPSKETEPESPEDDTENETAEPEKEPEKKPEKEDPWAGLNPALRTEFEGLKTKAGLVATLEERLKQAERRIGSITNDLSEAKKAAAETTKKEEKAPTKEEIDAAAKSAEEWEALKQEYPDWADAIDARLSEKEKGITKAVTEQIEAIKKSGLPVDEIKKQIEEIRQEAIQEAQENAKTLVAIKYPEWIEDVNSEDFKNFMSTASDEIKQRCGSWKAKDAIFVLDKFYESSGNGSGKKTAAEIARERKQRLSKSELPSSGRIRQPVKREDEMTDEEYRKKIAQDTWAET